MYALLTIAAGILWGVISIFIRPLEAAGFSTMQVLMVRGIFSSLMLLIFILIKDRSLLKIHWKDLWMFIGTGVVSLTFFSFCYFKTIVEIGTSIAVILLYTSPIFVLIFSVFLFKEKITWLKLGALAVTFAGCILVTGIAGGSEHITLKGFLIGICAGLGYALYSIFSRYALAKYKTMTVTFYTFLFSSISVIPFCHAGQLKNILFTPSPDAASTSRVWLLILGISLICTVLPYIFYTKGLSGLETGLAAIIVTVEPLVGTLIGFILWKEPVSVAKIIGIICIFAAVIVLGLSSGKKDEEKIETTGEENE